MFGRIIQSFRKRIGARIIDNEGSHVKLTSRLNNESIIISDDMIAIQRKKVKFIDK